MSAPQIIRTPSGEELVVRPGTNMRHSLSALIARPRMPTMSLYTMPGRPNWLLAVSCCPRRLVLRFFEGRVG